MPGPDGPGVATAEIPRLRGGRIRVSGLDEAALGVDLHALVVEPPATLAEIAEPDKLAGRHGDRDRRRPIGPALQQVNPRGPVVEAADDADDSPERVGGQGEGDLAGTGLGRSRQFDHGAASPSWRR